MITIYDGIILYCFNLIIWIIGHGHLTYVKTNMLYTYAKIMFSL